MLSCISNCILTGLLQSLGMSSFPLFLQSKCILMRAGLSTGGSALPLPGIYHLNLGWEVAASVLFSKHVLRGDLGVPAIAVKRENVQGSSVCQRPIKLCKRQFQAVLAHPRCGIKAIQKSNLCSRDRQALRTIKLCEREFRFVDAHLIHKTEHPACAVFMTIGRKDEQKGIKHKKQRQMRHKMQQMKLGWWQKHGSMDGQSQGPCSDSQ